MADNNKNLTSFRDLLSRFDDKKTIISDNVLLMAEQFLFHGISNPDLFDVPALHRTLAYLKNLMERNGFTMLDDLQKYYERKRRRTSEVFDKLEKVDPEECMAIDFHEACTMYMQPLRGEHTFKSSCLYYLHGESGQVQTDIKIITYKASLEEERRFLAAVKGNSITVASGRCCLPGYIEELVSN